MSMVTDINMLASGGLSSLHTIHSRLMATVVPNRQLLCLWSPFAVFALKRKTGEHTFGALALKELVDLLCREFQEQAKFRMQ